MQAADGKAIGERLPKLLGAHITSSLLQIPGMKGIGLGVRPVLLIHSCHGAFLHGRFSVPPFGMVMFTFYHCMSEACNLSSSCRGAHG